MSDNPSTPLETNNTSSPTVELNKSTDSNSTNPEQSNSLITRINKFISSWKFKLTAIFVSIFGVLLIIFFWKHIIAMQSLKGWANHAQAQAIDCMIQDTNDDQYISCTAKLDNQIVPLECGTSLFNMGCRVNYGNATPSVKIQQKTANQS